MAAASGFVSASSLPAATSVPLLAKLGSATVEFVAMRYFRKPSRISFCTQPPLEKTLAQRHISVARVVRSFLESRSSLSCTCKVTA